MLPPSRTVKWSLVAALLAALGCDGSGGGNANTPPANTATGCSPAAACGPPGEGVFVLGSSYSWDAQPYSLDDDPEWDIFCSKWLDFIFQFPAGACVASSTPWTDVLEPPAHRYAFISFQPVPAPASTQALDIARITYWLQEQPLSTVAVIHATWPGPGNWEEMLHDPHPDNTLTNYSLAYYDDLLDELELANPGRVFVLTRSNEMMDYVFHDPAAPIAFADFFRDTVGHMSLEIGQYLQHNALRQAMDQPTGIDPTINGVPPLVKAYLDEVIALHPAS